MLPPSSLKFRISTDDDMKKIHQWLEVEYEKNNQTGFLCNWELTQKTHNNGNVLVCVDKSSSNDPIAYMWLDFGIVNVKEEFAKQGVGRSLVEYALKHLSKLGVICVNIQCRPSTSIPFWKLMGFTFYDKILAYKIIDKTLKLPDGGSSVHVEIYFYPESKSVSYTHLTLPTKRIV